MNLVTLIRSTDMALLMTGINEVKKAIHTIKIAAMNNIFIRDLSMKNFYATNKNATTGKYRRERLSKNDDFNMVH